MVMAIIQRWLENFQDYSKVEEKSTDWKSYMYNHLANQSCFCLKTRSIISKYRCILVIVALMNVVPLFMLSSTYHIFYPELEWNCIVEPHTGETSICRLHDKTDSTSLRKYSPCIMELGIDYHWNSSFTNSPILEFDAYCPLERTVEPKLVNFLGSFCGSLVGGIFIDTLGRKNMALISVFFSTVTTFSYYMSSNMIMYTYQEFIKGLFSSVAMMSLLTWTVELSKPEYSSITITSFWLSGGLGEMAAIGLTCITKQWRMVVVIISAIGIGLIPVLFLIPTSLRYMIAKGKVKRLPNHIRFIDGMIHSARAKDCLSRSQTNRLYATNALLLILLGFSAHNLADVISIKYSTSDIFQRLTIEKAVMIIGYIIAVFLSFLPLFMYLLNVFMILIGGIFAIVATSTNYSDSPWSLSRVFTGACLMLATTSISLTFTTMKQIPTLNRGFYVSSLNASLMLGSLFYIIVQSWCLEKENAEKNFCSHGSEDTKLLTSGIIMCVSVALAFINTCLTKNIALPHSYQELAVRPASSSSRTKSRTQSGENPRVIVEENGEVPLNGALHQSGSAGAGATVL